MRRSVLLGVVTLATFLGASGSDALAQRVPAPAPALPFELGERLEYRVHLSVFGDVGRGTMWVQPDTTRVGSPLWLLRFDMAAGKGPIRAIDQTSSWLDPARFAIQRFEKRERHPLSRSVEVVVIDTAAHTFTDSGNPASRLGSDAPLDELSFIYYLRTLSLAADSVFSLDRHFDPARNPTVVRVRGRDTVETGAGPIATWVVEMEVRDPKRYRGTGIITIHLSDDACRVPVRIESRMPVVGVTTLTLSSRGTPGDSAVRGLCRR